MLGARERPSVTDIPKRVARAVMRRVLPFKERKRDIALKATLAEIHSQALKSRDGRFAESNVLFNVALFLLIAERDIQAQKIDALTHPDAWRRSLSARVILLTIHEWDMDKVTGRKLKQALEVTRVPQELRQSLMAALRSVREVQRKARKEFSFLRNATIAHRDPDALRQYQAIVELDEMGVLELAGKFYLAANAFISLLPKVILHIGSMPGLMAQIAYRAESAART
jgi:hypothetical protein